MEPMILMILSKPESWPHGVEMPKREQRLNVCKAPTQGYSDDYLLWGP